MSAPTGGQYSVARAVLGVYLGVHFALLLPWGAETFSRSGVLPEASLSPLASLFPNVLRVFDAPSAVTVLLVLAVVLSILLALGVWDRAAALGLAYVNACLLGRNPLIANPALPFIGFLLVTHAFLPVAPYGSLRAAGRPDPAGGWRFPREIFVAMWVVMALAYTYGGYTKLGSPSWLDGSAFQRVLENPLARPGVLRQALLALPDSLLRLATWGALTLELLFAPAALFRVLRPWLWLLMVFMHLGLLSMVAFADLTLGMLVVHLFTFDRAWVPPRRVGAPEWLFYDGDCGLCQGAVRFVVAEDPGAQHFRFAPLGGPTFSSEVDVRDLPDSLVVLTREGRLLVRSEALLHVGAQLGGIWRVLAALVRLVPRAFSDFLYDRIAAVRKRLFRAPAEACPVMPAELRRRFDP